MTAPSPIVQQRTVVDTLTDWSRTGHFNQFDPSQGTLTSIAVGLTADITGSVSVESLEAAPATVVISQLGNISVTGPADVLLADATPFASTSVNLGAYDGTTNYTGASGTIVPLSNTATVDTTLSVGGGTDLGGFIGTGSVAVSASASTVLDISGPANMQIQSHASAGAIVDLEYNYTAPSGGSSGDDDYGDFTFGGISALPGLAIGNTVTTAPQTFTVADSTTGSIDQLVINQFNPALGTLEGINITLSGNLSTSVAAENEDATAASVLVTQNATEALALPGTAVTDTGQTSSSLTLGGYDGTPDFAGTSGTILQSQMPMSTTSDTVYDTTDLAAFSGTGTVATTISSSSTASLTGPGNLLARLTAETNATVTVSYDYVPAGVSADAIGWESVAGGEWADGTNWSSWSNPPASTDDVAITLPGTYTVTLAADQSIHSIVIDSPDATLVLDGNLTAAVNVVLDAGTIDFNGGTIFADEFIMNGGLLDGGTVDVNAAGSIVLNAGSVIATNLVLVAGPPIIAPPAGFGFSVVDQTPVLGFTAAECFARGSHIATPQGDVRVEKLAVGDSVILASGGSAPIVWIGHREIDCRRHPQPAKVWPVRIARNACGDGRPHRDLLLSPDHAVFLDDILIPVKYLINGTTIRQVSRQRIAYFHIELACHDVVLAEGLPAETYLDVGNRNRFANNPGAVVLHPDFWSLAREAEGYAPLVVTGPRIASARRMIAALASMAA